MKEINDKEGFIFIYKSNLNDFTTRLGMGIAIYDNIIIKNRRFVKACTCTLYILDKRKLKSIIHVIIVRIRVKLGRSISFIRRVKFLAKQK